ncbi:MAG: thiamine phosphate synthase [Myxococcaceae bacterium]|nr:thiamine phosphate synthase [Myxococcaceae bacterium]
MDKSPGFLPGLYALVDDQLRPDLSLLQKVHCMLSAGVGVLQLRLKVTPESEAVPLIRQAVALAAATQTAVIVNDRADWARLGRADGVHLGADDVPISVARQALGPQAIVGATVRSEKDLQAAQSAGADYVGLGPVFSSSTKSGSVPPLGLEGFGVLAAKSPLPVVAISGLRAEHMTALSALGAYAAAVGAAVWNARDITENAKALNAAFMARMKE